MENELLVKYKSRFYKVKIIRKYTNNFAEPVLVMYAKPHGWFKRYKLIETVKENEPFFYQYSDQKVMKERLGIE